MVAGRQGVRRNHLRLDKDALTPCYGEPAILYEYGCYPAEKRSAFGYRIGKGKVKN